MGACDEGVGEAEEVVEEGKGGLVGLRGGGWGEAEGEGEAFFGDCFVES